LVDHWRLKHQDTGEAEPMARREVQSEITGRVWKIEAQPGERVAVDQPIVILESMKMEIPISAPVAGTVAEVLVTEKDVVEEGQIVAVLDI
jgi:acetyl-CoA carboxylase biotin carboxyl carrier protein